MFDLNIKNLENGKSISSYELGIMNQFEEVCKSFTDSTVVARIAGGWVRDHVLGKENNDIDIAIQGRKTSEFAERFKEMFPEAKIVTMKANPKMSKYLDVSRICVDNKKGLWIDICQLRPDDLNHIDTEEGTPLSDACRRDYTINALFFNINTRKLEDFVGGIQDIKNKIIRTPIEPEKTFTDDPIRIIRGFRFAAKYDFKIDENVLEAIPKMKDMFRSSISRDRLSQELLKALNEPDIILVLDLIIKCKLFDIIFMPPETLDMNNFLENVKVALSRCKNTEYNLPVVCAVIYNDLYGKKVIGDKISVIRDMIVNKLRFSLKIMKDTKKIIKAVHILPREMTRKNVGIWLRKIGPIWDKTDCLLFDKDTHEFYINTVLPFIEKENLTYVINMKSLISGNEIAKLYEIKPGPKIAELINELIILQIKNPNMTKEDYYEFAKNKKEKLQI